MKRFSKLISWMLMVSVLGGCTVVSNAPTVTTTAAPAIAIPVQSSSTPPEVIVVSPTPASVEPVLEQTPGSTFCSEPQVQAAIEGFISAVKAQDGTALAEIIDPFDGLDIYYRLANPSVHLPPDEIGELFSSTIVYTWGDQAGSGLPVEGTFSEAILPGLLDVFERSFSQACQDLASGVGTGPTTALVDWPADYAGMPFIALFRAAGAGDNELDWRTWAVGFTVVDGHPKIRVLVQYIWEI